MDSRTSTPQGAAPRDPSTERGPDPRPGPAVEAQSGATLIAGQALVQTVRHFFPRLNQWLDGLPDTRVQEACTYSRRFLGWWGLWLYLAQLGSRRQLDYELRDGGAPVLANLNRLADTEQTTLPVHDTLDYFLEHSTLAGWEHLRCQCVQRLVRMKALEAARLQGRFVVLLDATNLVCFHRRHCPYCLVHKGTSTLYLHHVLEAMLLGPGGVVLSLGSEFIENADAGSTTGRTAEAIKQDCELKAMQRLLPRLKAAYPQLSIVLAADSLYAVGPVFALVQELGWSLVATFKEGRTPALWQEFQSLQRLCPQNCLRRDWADRPVQEFRWVNQLPYKDSAGRQWQLSALDCTETAADGSAHYFAWLTYGLPVNRSTVEEIAQKGGRDRWKIENEGFNREKSSGLNLEHVYSIDPEKGKLYYVLLQIAFILVQLLERGSLLRRLANELGRPVLKLFGSLKNIAKRLLESLRHQQWADEWFDPGQAARLHLGLNSS